MCATEIDLLVTSVLPLFLTGVHSTSASHLLCGAQSVPSFTGHWSPSRVRLPANAADFHRVAGYDCGDALAEWYRSTQHYFCGYESKYLLETAFKQFSWSWEPDVCYLPRMGTDLRTLIRRFLESTAGSRFVFAGDSISLQQFISLRCLLGKEIISKEDSTRIDTFTTTHNVEFVNSWSPYLVNKTTLQVIQTTYDGTGPSEQQPSQYLQNERLQKDFALSLLENGFNWENTQGIDEQPYSHLLHDNATYLVLNTGAHWHGNVEAYSVMVGNVLGFLQKKFAGRRVFYRASTHAHTGCINANAPQELSDSADQKYDYNYRMLEHYNAIWKFEIEQLKDDRFVYLDVYTMSKDRADGHVKGTRQDCLHWCLPGIVDYWNLLIMSVIVHDRIAAARGFGQ